MNQEWESATDDEIEDRYLAILDHLVAAAAESDSVATITGKDSVGGVLFVVSVCETNDGWHAVVVDLDTESGSPDVVWARKR